MTILYNYIKRVMGVV